MPRMNADQWLATLVARCWCGGSLSQAKVLEELTFPALRSEAEHFGEYDVPDRCPSCGRPRLNVEELAYEFDEPGLETLRIDENGVVRYGDEPVADDDELFAAAGRPLSVVHLHRKYLSSLADGEVSAWVSSPGLGTVAMRADRDSELDPDQIRVRLHEAMDQMDMLSEGEHGVGMIMWAAVTTGPELWAGPAAQQIARSEIFVTQIGDGEAWVRSLQDLIERIEASHAAVDGAADEVKDTFRSMHGLTLDIEPSGNVAAPTVWLRAPDGRSRSLEIDGALHISVQAPCTLAEATHEQALAALNEMNVGLHVVEAITEADRDAQIEWDDDLRLKVSWGGEHAFVANVQSIFAHSEGTIEDTVERVLGMFRNFRPDDEEVRGPFGLPTKMPCGCKSTIGVVLRPSDYGQGIDDTDSEVGYLRAPFGTDETVSAFLVADCPHHTMYAITTPDTPEVSDEEILDAAHSGIVRQQFEVFWRPVRDASGRYIAAIFTGHNANTLGFDDRLIRKVVQGSGLPHGESVLVLSMATHLMAILTDEVLEDEEEDMATYMPLIRHEMLRAQRENEQTRRSFSDGAPCAYVRSVQMIGPRAGTIRMLRLDGGPGRDNGEGMNRAQRRASAKKRNRR